MNYNLLAHVDLDDAGRACFACVNIVNYINALPENSGAQIVLVANGPAVKHFVNTEANAAVLAKAKDLMARGVAIRLCNNALNTFKIDRANLLPGCEVVPAGVLEIVRLENEGFSYIKP